VSPFSLCFYPFVSPAIDLAQYLISQGAFIIGAISDRRSRLNASEKRRLRRIRPFESQFLQRDYLTLALFRTKDVHGVLSSCKSEKKIVRAVQREDSGEEITENIPEEWALYRQHMGGVDIANQLVANYSTKRKSFAPWFPIFFWALDVCIINSYYLYKHSTAPHLTHLQFREKLVNELLGKEDKINKKRSRSEAKTQETEHFFESLDGKSDCCICSTQKHSQSARKQTRHGCRLCQTYLCSKKCFLEFHRMDA
jgi:hypothetical protein